MTRAATLLLACLALCGCVEAYRWVERPTDRPPTIVRDEPAPSAEGHYVVKQGDTLYSIAFRNQLDFRELAVWNDVGPDYKIRPQQVLRLSPPPVDESGMIRTAPLGGTPEPSPGMLPLPESPAVGVATAPAPTPIPDTGPAAARARGAAARAGGRRWPLGGPVVKTFGPGSKGVDIAGDLGQPVLAAAPGKVVYSGSALRGYGELVIIKHNEQQLSAYGYNRRRLVAEGQSVSAGQPIAELGMGPEQKPVLHFEIREKGKPVDPAGILPPR